jgi:hypothetical protein
MAAPQPPDGPPADLPAVLALAAHGWRVFPCRPRDKTPLVREWQHIATTGPEQIRAWYAEYPACNWGIATGRASGTWVLDVDGAQGTASLKALVTQHGALPARLTVRTGKGLHLYFAWPRGHELRNSAGKIGEGLDVRAEGGYVLAPGSVHPSGAIYAVAQDGPVPDAPEWLVQMATSPATATAAVTDGDRIPQGKGEPAKFKLALKLLKANQTRDVVLAAVLALDAKCEHRLGEAECKRKVDEWAERYARGEPIAGPRRAEIVTLSDVQPREVDWLWRPYLPAGMLAMLSGDPGVGKTFLVLAIAAALTTGHVPNSQETTCTPIDVLYMSIENDPACVVRPRFDKLGGNPSRLHIVTGAVIGEGEDAQHDAVWLSDIDALHDALERTQARLMIVDPIQSYLGAAIDFHRSNETRPVLDGLARLAQQHNCGVLIARHLSKARGGRAIHAGLGSIDLTGAVRTELLAGYAAEDQQHRALVQVKSNVGEYGAALGFVIEQGLFQWTGESTLTATDILAPESTDRESGLIDAAEWLREYLGAGERTAKEIEQAAGGEGFSKTTLHRARKQTGVITRKLGFGGGWIWQLPTAEDSKIPEDSKDSNTEKLESSAQVGIFEREKGEL